MKRILIIATAALSLLLGGCASTVRSNVTTFHEWPADLSDKSYVLEAPAPQDDTLEVRSYQNLVRGELARLGFREAVSGTPAMKVSMRFTTTDIMVRSIEPIWPTYYVGSRYMLASPFNRPHWGGRHHWGGGYYSALYDPFWGGMPAYTERIRHTYRRELQVAIKSAADGKRLFDVTVHNNSNVMSTPAQMPALVQSAFVGFPGVSGVARRVELKRERAQKQPAPAAAPVTL
ncbi:MAG: DUF4136 domain-containing protein [Pseudomonadota bacterium]